MPTAIQNKRQQQWVFLLGRLSAYGTHRAQGARRAGGLIVLGLAFGFGLAAPAAAESLKDALSAAYGYNPRLDAQRAFQRASDEDVARAMSGYRPTVTGNAENQYEAEYEHASGAPRAKRTGQSFCRRVTQEENPLLLTQFLVGRPHHIPPATPTQACPEPNL